MNMNLQENGEQESGNQGINGGTTTSWGSEGTGTGAATKHARADGEYQNRGAEGKAEGPVAKTIEQQTAKLPSDLFLWAAVGAMGTSAILEFSGQKDKSRFIGQWVAPFLLFGVYNKLVKQHGSDQTSNA